MQRVKLSTVLRREVAKKWDRNDISLCDEIRKRCGEISWYRGTACNTCPLNGTVEHIIDLAYAGDNAPCVICGLAVYRAGRADRYPTTDNANARRAILEIAKNLEVQGD